MEAATLAGLAGNAAVAPGRFAAPMQGSRPAQQPGILQSPAETTVADSAVLSALPYAQRLRRVGRSRLYQKLHVSHALRGRSMYGLRVASS